MSHLSGPHCSVILLSAAMIVAGCSNSNMQIPGGASGPSISLPGGSAGSVGGAGGSQPASGSQGSQGGSGMPGGMPSAGSSSGPGMPGTLPGLSLPGVGETGGSSAGGAKGGKSGAPGTKGAGGSGDPQGEFDKSLGDFDGEIAREREAMAAAGKGSGRGAETRETGDAGAVKDSKGGSARASAGKAGQGSAANTGSEGGADDDGSDAGADVGPPPGQDNKGAAKTEPSDKSREPKDASGAKGPGPVAPIPDDVPRDGTGEDQVAREIREAAEAEEDPKVREALWDEYRRVMKIGK